MTFALLYHDVAERDRMDSVGFPGPLAARYKLEPEAFERHLDALADAGVDVGLVAPGADPPAVALTFDDGGASALAAAESLERRGWRGHFFVTTGRIGTAGFLSPAGAAELASRGHVVGSHSHSHPTLMGRLPRERIDEEWQRSRDVLSGVLGRPPHAASVPGGYLSGAVVDAAAAAGYAALMTSEPVATVKTVDGMLVLGRFSMWSTTSPARAVAYASGARLARLRLWSEWKLKRAATTLSPSAYQALRRVRARRR